MIYLVDYIGVHCGMHYYLDAFKQLLEREEGVKVAIVSNYNYGGQEPVLLNHYKGNKLSKIKSALINVGRLRRFVRSHPTDRFIYLTYGTLLDPMFLSAVTANPNHCVDIHEAIAQDMDHHGWLKKILAREYRKNVRNVIVHSERTEKFLDEFRYNGEVYRVPHLKYVFPREYDTATIPEDVREAVMPDKVNLLFFGNLTKEKGVDILIESINLLDDEAASKINVVIAGKDRDGSCRRVAAKAGRNIHFITRHITDDELRYLYAHTDYLSLPYRKTSQSGILEMAFYFRKPIVASDIPYFRKMLTEFPSFGVLAGNGADELSESLRKLVKDTDVKYFAEEDYARYENRAEIDRFMHEFKSWLN